MSFVRMCDRCGKIVREKNIVHLNKMQGILDEVDFHYVHFSPGLEICKHCYQGYAEAVRNWWKEEDRS